MTDHNHIAPVRRYVAIGAILLALLGVTLLVSAGHFGTAGVCIGLLIAAIKAGLVSTYFMHLDLASPVTRLAAAAGLFWLSILIVLTLNDFLTRGL